MRRSLLTKFFFICIGSLLLVSCQQKSKWQIEESEIERKIQAEIEKLEANNNGQAVADQIVYFGFDSLKSEKLKVLVNTPKLILYFSANTCSSCVDQTVETIESIFPGYKTNDNIVFVSPDYPVRYRINCYGKKLLTLMNGKFDLPLENTTQPPFFIVVGDEMKVLSIHVVNKMNFVRTEKYLIEIANRFKLE